MSDLDENVPARAPGDPGDCYFTPTIDPQSKDNSGSFPLDGIDLNAVSNADLIKLLDTAPLLYEISSTKVVRISKDLVLKAGARVLPCEAKTLRLLAEKTTVPAPRVYREFHVKNNIYQFGTRGYLVLDYIDGENLGDCWKSLTSQQKSNVVHQTVEIVKKLQAVDLPTAGPLDLGSGPFNSTSEMEAWFNHKLSLCQRINRAAKDIRPFKFSKFVLTHQDISPRNIILDASGKVWLIDWSDAGAYPPAFERAAIASQYRFPEFNKMTLDQLRPKYELEELQLASIDYALTVATFA